MCEPGRPGAALEHTDERVARLERAVEDLLRATATVPRQAGADDDRRVPARPTVAAAPGHALERRRHDRRRSSVLDGLGPRERDVLALLAQGWSNAGVARQLHVSERTVEATASTVFRKLGLTPSPTTNRRVLAVLAYLGCETAVPPA